MQEGKGLHRRCRIGGFLLVFLSIAACSPAPLGAYPELESAAWISARGGAVFPAERIDIRYNLRERTFFGFISSLSNPFGIDDLITSEARIGFHSRVSAVWAGWALVHHPLYREDRLSLDLGARVLKRRLLFEIRPALRRRRVSGYSASLSRDLSIGASLRCSTNLDIGFGATLTDRDSWRASRTIVMVSLRLDALALIINHVSSDRLRRDVRVGAEIELGRRLILVTGYRTGGDEISGGVLIRFSDFLIGISVNSHVVLERTYSLSIGRVWVR